MRINIYSEEMHDGVELIEKHNVNGNKTFYGLRIFLKSPQELLDHSTPEDDDRNAITIWARDEKELSFYVDQMAQALGGDARFFRDPKPVPGLPHKST